MTNIKMMRDPYDPQGEPMIVDLDDMVTIQITDNWCSGCKANVSYKAGEGSWTWWAGERDKWYCEGHE